jgi:hypothetical protein
MKKILIICLFFFTGLIAHEIPADPYACEPMLISIRLLAYYPYYGINDELCLYNEQRLESLLETLIHNRSNQNLLVLYCITQEMLRINAYPFIKYLNQKIATALHDLRYSSTT